MLEISFAEILFTMASVLFPFWPIVFIVPMRGRRKIYGSMAAVWLLMFVLWILTLISPYETVSFLIPEPWNTILFVLSGFVLIAVKVGSSHWQRRSIQRKADSASSAIDLLDLSPTEFENMVVELYSAMGHRASRTGQAGDHGIDVVVNAKNGEKWVVQCKRWRGSVGEPVIRDFFGAMHHEKADRGAIITTGTFTEQAKTWARGKPITLLEGHEFFDYLKLARNRSKA